MFACYLGKFKEVPRDVVPCLANKSLFYSNHVFPLSVSLLFPQPTFEPVSGSVFSKESFFSLISTWFPLLEDQFIFSKIGTEKEANI